MGEFDGNADSPIDEDRALSVLGLTRRQWLSDPRITGTSLNPRHARARRIGEVLQPYIGKTRKAPVRDMLSIIGGLYLDDPEGRQYYECLMRGEPIYLSIDYETRIENGVKTGTELKGIGLVPNPKNPDCTITVLQEQGDSTLVSFSLPLKDVRILPSSLTKTLSLEKRWRFPLLQQNSSTEKHSSSFPPPMATPAAATQPSIPAQAAASTAAATPPAAATAAAGDAMKVDPPAAAAAASTTAAAASVNLVSTVEELLRQREAEKRRADELEAKLREANKANEERLAKEVAERRKQLETYKPYFQQFGINPEDADHKAHMEYLVSDPNAALFYKMLTTGMDAYAKTHSELDSTKKQAEELRNASAEIAKRLKLSTTPLGAREETSQSAAAAAASSVVLSPAAREAKIAADKAAVATTLPSTSAQPPAQLLTPSLLAQRYKFPAVSGAGTPAAAAAAAPAATPNNNNNGVPGVIQSGNTMTFLNTVAPGSTGLPLSATGLVAVRQDATSTPTATGDPISSVANDLLNKAATPNQKVAAQVLTSNVVVTPTGREIDLSQEYFKGQFDTQGGNDLSVQHRLALFNSLNMYDHAWDFRPTNDRNRFFIDQQQASSSSRKRDVNATN